MEELKNKSKENGKEEIDENNISESDDEMVDLIEFDHSKFLKNEDKDNIILKRYNIYFFLNLSKDNTFIFPIESDIFNVNNQHVYELIKSAVKNINNKKIRITYNNINYIVSLKDIEEEENMDFYTKNYELRPCKKKNFMPKNDCPSYSSSSLLKNLENKNISFISKRNLNIMLLEKLETYEEKNNQKYNIDDEDEFI